MFPKDIFSHNYVDLTTKLHRKIRENVKFQNDITSKLSPNGRRQHHHYYYYSFCGEGSKTT